MADGVTTLSVPFPDSAKTAMAALEAQVAGLKSMIPGAKAAGMDTLQMEQTVTALETSMAALRGIPGAR